MDGRPLSLKENGEGKASKPRHLLEAKFSDKKWQTNPNEIIIAASSIDKQGMGGGPLSLKLVEELPN